MDESFDEIIPGDGHVRERELIIRRSQGYWWVMSRPRVPVGIARTEEELRAMIEKWLWKDPNPTEWLP